MDRPNVLVIMTDQERYPPPYEGPELAAFRDEHLPARRQLRERGVEFHRHYVGATACLPSRASLFTGQYPSLHGVTQTDGLAKKPSDPSMSWLDPDTVPTMGDWFRAGGYRTHYRGKWHISHADLVVPGSHRSLRASDADGVIDQRAVDTYRRADRLDPFGFSGWIGREPHGADPADSGYRRDGVFAEQVVELFDEVGRSADPWLAVASFVNPHDICFGVPGWGILGFDAPGPEVPEVPEAPSQSDGFEGRPPCHEAFVGTWSEMLFPQIPDGEHRRLYHHLHRLVDQAIARILGALADAGLAEETVVVLTSDHGELLGAHGGMLQKWHNAFEETIRVPMVVAGPGIAPTEEGVTVPTSHLDVLPTLLGLAGIDVDAAAEIVAGHHVETHPLVGRDLGGLLDGSGDAEALRAPLYFMTEDDISRGLDQRNMLTGEVWEAVPRPSRVESVIATLPTGEGGVEHLWKLNRYYDRVDGDPAGDLWEAYDLTADPEERVDLAAASEPAPELDELRVLLERQRSEKRVLPDCVTADR